MVSGPRVVLLLSLVVLGFLAAVPTSATTAASGQHSVITGQSAQPQTATDSTVTEMFVVNLESDGDARWTITKTFNLTSENETAAFESVADSFTAGETSDLGLASYRRASQLAAESTTREMQITNVSRSTVRTGTATNGTGQLSISFTWTNFGRLDGDKLYLDDVFTTSQGLWFEQLYASQQLIIQPPEEYTVFDAVAPVQGGTIQWTGPEDFTAEKLSATFEQTGNGGPTTPTPTPRDNTTTPPSTTTTTTGTTPGGNDSGSLLWAGLVTLGLGAVVVGYLLVRERDLLDRPDTDESGGDGSPDRPSAGSEAVAPTAQEGTDGETAETTDGSDSEDDDNIDAALLSDEERVERLLEQNGGRMKQATIVKETKWSNAKVSQLLSSMEEDGQIDKLRIGRENLISFPDEDITDFKE